MARKVSEDKIQKALAKYGMENLSEPKDMESVTRIAQELVGTGLQEAGMTMSMGIGAKTSDRLQVYYQRAIMEQNWIIIRLLDRIAKALEK